MPCSWGGVHSPAVPRRRPGGAHWAQAATVGRWRECWWQARLQTLSLTPGGGGCSEAMGWQWFLTLRTPRAGKLRLGPWWFGQTGSFLCGSLLYDQELPTWVEMSDKQQGRAGRPHPGAVRGPRCRPPLRACSAGRGGEQSRPSVGLSRPRDTLWPNVAARAQLPAIRSQPPAPPPPPREPARPQEGKQKLGSEHKTGTGNPAPRLGQEASSG